MTIGSIYNIIGEVVKVKYFTFFENRGDFMAKDLKMCVLLDIYGELLTEKQYEIMDFYYNQDYSLAEISEHLDITRQGVRDSIKRSEQTLTELEEKLKLSEKFRSNRENFEKISKILNEMSHYNNIQIRNNKLQNLLSEIAGIIDKLEL